MRCARKLSDKLKSCFSTFQIFNLSTGARANPPAGAADGQAAEVAGMKDGQVVLKD